jgi:acyl dehydratase
MTEPRRLPFGLDPSVLGEVFDESTSEPVTREEIREYAELVGETDPRFFADEPIAPPTFVVRFRGPRFSHPSLPASDVRRGFDAGKDIRFGVAVRPGDVIHTRNELHDLYEKTGRSGTMVFVVSRQTMTNQRGETVAVIDSRYMMRGGDGE